MGSPGGAKRVPCYSSLGWSLRGSSGPGMVLRGYLGEVDPLVGSPGDPGRSLWVVPGWSLGGLKGPWDGGGPTW